MLNVGIDIGSTTVKVVALDAENGETVFQKYARHHANQAKTAASLLLDFASKNPCAKIKVAFTGSGGLSISKALGLPFVQEVVANSIALGDAYPATNTAIELGGQDAKIIFFKGGTTGKKQVEDMRMNGTCAGGTGAFIDEIAKLLNTPIEKFNALAEAGKSVYPISGRCGVFAKTDIQPLLNSGASKEDLALSTFHAIAKQTIGGLAQGLEIKAPVCFEGGPLTFNPQLIKVFAERLGLKSDEVIIPEHPETIVARGAALSIASAISVEQKETTAEELAEKLASLKITDAQTEAPFFSNEKEKNAFLEAHKTQRAENYKPAAGELVAGYLGVDSGSTTSKFALINEDGQLLYSFYANNEGTPIDVIKAALLEMNDYFTSFGATLQIEGVCTTGYGEDLFDVALNADFHTVETVAHARAATELNPNTTFILDIGGQDMKAIWVNDGVITNILVNEACSSGCGSFLENFASNLQIPVTEIASAAFASSAPAHLGSRCTVFMNSSIVTAQAQGSNSNDIMAGLCRSIIENVFTKVIRISNTKSLGEHIVVQGGTFANDAVLKAFEDYVGVPVTRAPYPGLSGAIGAALIARDNESGASTFIGFDALKNLTYTSTSSSICKYCSNHCSRNVVEFSNGETFVTGNRCEKGKAVSPSKAKVKAAAEREKAAEEINIFDKREELLFKDYTSRPHLPCNGKTVGLPRILSFWDDAPFWRTFFESLGYKVKFSNPNNREAFEAGLKNVMSDTICFPAKLAHGAIKSLANEGVDFIFYPIVTTVPSENMSEVSQSRCAVVKGYPYVLRASDNPELAYGVPFKTPLFHWFTAKDREEQLVKYFTEEFEFGTREVKDAIKLAQKSQDAFRKELEELGKEALTRAEQEGRWSVILAGRPYHSDPIVNHGIAKNFARLGVTVLPPDAISELSKIDLHNSRIDVVNNYHARVLESALYAATHENVQFAQLVSFGCGHDAYLSDEATRIMHETSSKSPLILKIDESDAQGALKIRIKSFVETAQSTKPSAAAALKDPYPVKYEKADRQEKVVLVPNTSHAFCRLMTAAFRAQGVRTEPLELGREEAIALGKKYVHNDICFPAQMVIGEALGALMSGKYDVNNVAIGMGKYIGDCRLTHYSALLRRALDSAGFSQVPIIDNDDADAHNLHPGFKMNTTSALNVAYGLPMIDALEELLRKIRPYELNKGETDKAFDKAIDLAMDGIEANGVTGAKHGFKQAIDVMKQVEYDRSNPRPRVLIVGEYLLNFHPGANRDVEKYLEDNGLEIVEARMTDVIRKTYFYQHAQSKEFNVHRATSIKIVNAVSDSAFEFAHNLTDKIASAHPLYEPPTRMPELVRESDEIIHHTFDAGEGVLIPAEILQSAKHGVNNFVILQPFGCLPNHIVGRGIVKALKSRCPNAFILSLDYDPDVSFANIQNRLQMLILNAK